MRLLATVAAVALMCGAAEARTVTYTYLGQEMNSSFCVANPATIYCLGRPPYSITGTVSFDLSRIPGRSLANAMIEFTLYDITPPVGGQLEYGEYWRMVYSFSSPNGNGQQEFQSAETDWSWTPLVDLRQNYEVDTAFYYSVFHPMFFDTEFKLTFDANSEVASWSMTGIWGGTSDWGSRYDPDCIFEYCNRDNDMDYSSDGPGKWTLLGAPDEPTVPDPDPQAVSPVPLPASALALLAGLGGLAAAGKRRRRRQDC